MPLSRAAGAGSRSSCAGGPGAWARAGWAGWASSPRRGIGLALGGGQLYYILEITRRDVAGLSLDYRYPVEIASALIPIIVGAAFIAALGPAEGAVRGSLVEALEYE